MAHYLELWSPISILFFYFKRHLYHEDIATKGERVSATHNLTCPGVFYTAGAIILAWFCVCVCAYKGSAVLYLTR